MVHPKEMKKVESKSFTAMWVVIVTLKKVGLEEENVELELC